MKTKIALLVLILCMANQTSLAEEPDVERISRNIIYNAERVPHKYPLLSYDGITYLSVRDAADLIFRNIRWEEGENKIFLDSKKEKSIQKEETAEKIGKAIVEEFYNDRITDSTVYRVNYVCKNLNMDDAYILSVIFEPEPSQELDDLYIYRNSDIQVNINSTNGSISICETQDDGYVEELDLIKIAKRKYGDD